MMASALINDGNYRYA